MITAAKFAAVSYLIWHAGLLAFAKFVLFMLIIILVEIGIDFFKRNVR